MFVNERGWRMARVPAAPETAVMNKTSVSRGCGDSLELQDGFSRRAEAGLVQQHLWVQQQCSSCGTARPEVFIMGEKAAVLRGGAGVV